MFCWIGCGLLVLTVMAFSATAIYESIVEPSDMHLPGLLTAVIIFYAVPTGFILLALGGLMRLGAFLRQRRKTVKNTSS